MSNIKGVSPDAEIVVNEHGGKQSKTAYGFHLIDTDAILSLAEVLQYGASRYERDNWRKIPSRDHFNHMMIHYYAWLKGDTTDDHLGHFFCRAMMLYATGKAEEVKDKPEPVKPSKWERMSNEELRSEICGGMDCATCPVPSMSNEKGGGLVCTDWIAQNPTEARKLMIDFLDGRKAELEDMGDAE